MILTPILLALAPAGSIEAPADLLAIRAPRVEVGNGETLHHAVILVEDGRIVTIGEDLPIERGIPVLELSEGQVVMPGLVCAYSRIGLSGNGFSDSRPWVKASDELYPASGDYPKVLEAGVTTLGGVRVHRYGHCPMRSLRLKGNTFADQPHPFAGRLLIGRGRGTTTTCSSQTRAGLAGG